VTIVGVLANRLIDDGVHREWVRRKYIEALIRCAGVEAVVLPTCEPARVRKEDHPLLRLDGLLLTGDESNLDPLLLRGGAAAGRPHWERGRRDGYRDIAAGEAIGAAVGARMPILGICRGLQELNVYFGGTLHRDLGAAHREDLSLPRDRQYDPVHDVRLSPGGELHSLLGRSTIRVNSLHGQGIDVLAEGLTAEGVAADGLVEAASVTGAATFQLGVQWHPEWHVDSDEAGQILFRQFGSACRNYSASRRR
jgi:putative glutamine amidotransferase